MIPVLIFIRPIDLRTGARVDIRIGSAAEATALGLDGQTWEPILARRPRIAQDVMSLDLDGTFKLAAADFTIALGQMRRFDRPDKLYWEGAPVIIFRADRLSWQLVTVEFAGIVSSTSPDRNSKRTVINCAVDRSRIDKPLLTKEFAGTGNAEGGATVRGLPKPAGFGFVESREWVLFDTVYNIGMLDGYGNLLSVQRAMEGLNDLGASVGDYASYAALKAAIVNKTIPPGRWGTCIAEGMVGLGAPPVGRITFNATFGSNRTGAIIKRMLSVHLGLAATEYIASDFDALDATVNREVRAHFRDQVNVSEVIQALVKPLNATPIINVQNRITVTRATLSAPIAVLNRSGSTKPRITDWRIAAPIQPVYRIAYRAARPGDVLDYSQVNYVDDIIDRGGYDPAETYRQGHVVYLPNGSSWLYVFATPTSGNYPELGSQYWSRQQAPVDAANITYSTGETLDSLKPAEAGATLGAIWSGNLAGRPGNLSSLVGSEGIRNSFVSISESGALAGGGGGQVTIRGIGYVGDLTATSGQNLVLNGDAESGNADGWALIEGDGPPFTSFASVADAAMGGARSFRLAKTSTSVAAAYGSRAVAVKPGERIVVSCDAYASSASGAGMYLRAHFKTTPPASGYIGAGERDALIDVVANGGFTTTVSHYEGAIVVPANCYWMTIGVYNYSSGPVDARFDNISAVRAFNWSTGLINRPSNLAGLIGNEGILNGGISIGASGALVGAGGGQVTITGLGFSGDLNATFGASWSFNLAGRPSNLAGLAGGEFILNASISISASGALSGAGGGQVSLPGLGAGWGATATEAQAANARVPVGSNSVVDSGFKRALAFYNFNAASMGGGLYLNLGAYSGKRPVAYIHGANGAAGTYADACSLGIFAIGGSTGLDNMRRLSLPVKQGDRIGVSLLVSTHRCDAQLFALVFNKDGVLRDTPSATAGFTRDGAQDGDNLGLMAFTWAVQAADAAYVQLMIRAVGNGNTDPYLFFAEPMLAKLADGQIAVPPYSPGPPDPVATEGAAWGSNLTGRPSNLASLGGFELILNAGISIGSNGALAGAGGGQVSIGGLGFSGDLNATFGASWSVSLAGRPGNLSNLAGNEFILNATISISSGGALAGAGGGQVSLPGLGAGGLAYKNKVGAGDVDIDSRVNGTGAGYTLGNSGLFAYSANNVMAIELRFQ